MRSLRARGAQDGQALVAALVVLAILFALAGGITVAASGLLQQGRVQQQAITDLTEQSQTADTIAQVATRPMCAVTAGTGTFPTIDSGDMTTLVVHYPIANAADGTTRASCVRVDGVDPDVPNEFNTELTWSGGCGTMQVPGRNLSLAFDARGPNTVDGTVYIDDQQGSCQRTLTVSGTPPCSGATPQSGCIECGKIIDSGLGVVQGTLDCDLSTRTSPRYLHIYNASSHSPARVFLFDHASSNPGVAYLLATRIGTGSRYEEAVLLVPPSTVGPIKLLYKAPLP